VVTAVVDMERRPVAMVPVAVVIPAINVHISV